MISGISYFCHESVCLEKLKIGARFCSQIKEKF